MKNQLVEEWIERGKRDLESAKVLFSRVNYYDIILFHIHQAIEKYIKGFLIYHGWKLKKIHDLEILITEAVNFDEFFQPYLDYGRKLTAFYFEERYPPGPVSFFSEEEVKNMLEIAEEIIDNINLHIIKESKS